METGPKYCNCKHEEQNDVDLRFNPNSTSDEYFYKDNDFFKKDGFLDFCKKIDDGKINIFGIEIEDGK